MRILFTTQGVSITLFSALYRKLAETIDIEQAAFVIADSLAYGEFLEKHPGFEGEGHILLKEWLVLGRSQGEPDFALLARYEEDLGEPGLFGSIVADRRLSMGPDCSYTQDYRRRFSDRVLLCSLQAGLTAMDHLFEELKPDVVVSFICATLFDHLAYQFAHARGIRYLNLRPMRIANNFIAATTLNDPSPELREAYALARTGVSSHLIEAREYIRRVREEHGKYEGTASPSVQPAQRVQMRGGKAAAAARFLKRVHDYYSGDAARDNHCPNPIRQALYMELINPWRARQVDRALRPQYVRPGELGDRRYAFFPLHAEPEVSLLVYARPLVNQIEVIRALAFSLPADMALVVKEHPWMVGKRRLGAYRKMLEIPRVRLAPPETEARQLAEGASLVTVLTSSVALEAVILERPVVTLGHCPFNLLPETMVRRCGDLTALPTTIRRLLAEHHHDEEALEAYASAVMDVSVPVNFYSVLLGRSFAYSDRPSSFDQDIAKLADYVAARLAEPTAANTGHAPAPAS